MCRILGNRDSTCDSTTIKRCFVIIFYGMTVADVILRGSILIIKPTGNEFEVYCDSNFVGDYNKDTSHYDLMTAKSRGGHIIMYARRSIVWSSKMLTEVTLSTTESEYCEISNALRSTIPLMNFVNETRERYNKNLTCMPIVQCKFLRTTLVLWNCPWCIR
jgi:hypothetical protein